MRELLPVSHSNVCFLELEERSLFQHVQEAASIWYEQRLPEARNVCLWTGARWKALQDWSHRHPEWIDNDEHVMAFVNACADHQESMHHSESHYLSHHLDSAPNETPFTMAKLPSEAACDPLILALFTILLICSFWIV